MDTEIRFRNVLRGCLACYLVGLFLFGGPILYWSYLTDFNDLATYFFWIAGMGALAAGVLSVVVALIWTILAMAQVRMHFIWVPVFAALLTGSLMGFTIVSLLIGVIFGVTFWLGAFGLKSKVIVRFQEPLAQSFADNKALRNDEQNE